jgi:hypothetical protein
MRLRDAHFYKRVPADVSETTKTGGIVSILAFGTIVWLVTAQYNEAFTSKRHTQLRLDRSTSASGSENIRINFNITLHHLPCQYTQLYLSDHVGSHKMGGDRNVHKVRLSRNGTSLGIFEPHKYGDSERGAQMAGHVFPWHKKEHTQGDATHQLAESRKHLSPDQQHVVSKVESAIQTAGKGAHTGRRLLALDLPQQPPKPTPAADTVATCITWAAHGECVSNSAYMLNACEASCSQVADSSTCAKWAEGAPQTGRCHDAGQFMAKFCMGMCVAGGPPSTPSAPADDTDKGAGGDGKAAAEGAVAQAKPVVDVPATAKATETKPADATPTADRGDTEPGGVYTPATPFSTEPSDLTSEGFSKLLKENPVVMVNFFAPWCFWSNKLAPAWQATAQRLHKRAWSQSVKMVRIDCTSNSGGEVCRSQAVHAFPSVRIYRGSSHAFEPYEYGRDDTVIWLHLVKIAAEILVNEMADTPPEERGSMTQQVAHVSHDLREVMDRRAQGLDEDWSEDALSSDEEVEEDRDLLRQISEAVGSITRGKGVAHEDIMRATGAGGDLEGVHELEAEAHYVNARASEMVLGLLTGRMPEEHGGGDADAEPWTESETHEGCNIFGYVDVSRAPGTLHLSPHSARHSFDFSAVNTSHHIDHLSFGLELTARERARLPLSVGAQLTTLDGSYFVAAEMRETKEHHVMIMPTSFGPEDSSIETYQFTSTSHGRTRDTLPSMLVSYDVSPIHAHITTKETPITDFLVSLCAIIGGAVSLFGIVDAMLFTGASTIKQKMGKGY